jgi:altronate hydrolase
LGAVAKAGTAPLKWVCDYAERVPGPGLGFMNGPAFDPPSATGQTAGGAQVGVFSTGRGSCFGGILTPWIKVVSNTETWLAIEDMEVNAGRIADGTATIQDVGREIFEMVIAVAGGARTYSEKAGYSVVNIWNSGAIT